MEQHGEIISGLRILNSALDGWLKRCKAHIHKDMVEVSPGIWINNRFKSFDECMQHCNDLIV